MIVIEELNNFIQSNINTLLGVNFKSTFYPEDFINRDFVGFWNIQGLEVNNKVASLKIEYIVKLSGRINLNPLRIYHWLRIFTILLNNYGVRNLTSHIVYEGEEEVSFYYLHFIFILDVSKEFVINSDFFNDNNLIKDIFLNDLGGKI